jgi:flavodoxin
MKALIIYDSKYGNTKQAAEAIGGSLQNAKVVPVDEADLVELKAYDLLVVGSPTQGGRPTPAVLKFLGAIPGGSLANASVATFDTRISTIGKSVVVRFFLKLVGFAAGRIAHPLQARGGKLVAPPEGFLVKGSEGPLESGELERAAKWAKKLAASDVAAQR